MNGASDAPPAVPHPWLKGVLTEREAVLVVGSYRCGTTSMFSYLADHPETNPSTIKEPAFFFSLRWHETPPVYPPGHEGQAYLSLFRGRGRVLLEGTSNYLHDPGCAQRIRDAMPNARVIIMLREPVARLASWYRFLQLQGWLGKTPFEHWIREQLDDRRPTDERPYGLQAVDHGFYARYVADFLRVFGDRARLVWFDDFKRDPRAVMKEVSAFAGIDPSFYDDYDFTTRNESMRLRSPRAYDLYRRGVRKFFHLFNPWPRLSFRLRELWYTNTSWILRLFTAPAEPVVVPPALRDELRALYRRDLQALREVTGQDPPWRASYER